MNGSQSRRIATVGQGSGDRKTFALFQVLASGGQRANTRGHATAPKLHVSATCFRLGLAGHVVASGAGVRRSFVV